MHDALCVWEHIAKGHKKKKKKKKAKPIIIIDSEPNN